MSWAEEDWTVGLSGRVLQKVKELQVHQDRLSRENKQKQLQLDNIQTSLEKQTVKVQADMFVYGYHLYGAVLHKIDQYDK
uniref:Centromere protein Cenp-F N-terminal domain-containing protein n=1 Tax=Seriola lalandi dorsalis TaxID=1841481 RepID=A0A3B4YE09_SERLL